MFPIDLRTIFLAYIIINMMSVVLIGSLYYQIRERFPVLKTFFISYILFATGNVFFFFQNILPDWITIVLSNLFIVYSTILLIKGIQKFVNVKSTEIYNYILMLLFITIHTYFLFYQPDLRVRILNFASIYIILSLQIVYLIFIRTPKHLFTLTWPLGSLFCVVALLEVYHFSSVLKTPTEVDYFFDSKSFEAFFIIAWLIVNTLILYSIIFMFNKSLNKDLNKQEEKFSKAFHEAPFIILLSKLSDGKIFEANNYIESIAGYNPVEIIGRKTTDLHMWNDDQDREKFKMFLQSWGKVKEQEYMFRKKSGELFPGLISAETIEVNNENCIIAVITDITERKLALQKILDREASLKELNSTKDKFFSIISHDLRGPVNGIMGLSQLLVEQIKTKDYDGIDEQAHLIHKSTKKAVDLLKNLLDWSRMQTGRLKYTPGKIDVIKLIHSVSDLLYINYRNKEIDLNLKIPESLIVDADGFMLETVLRNLISNAIKFTPRGGHINVSIDIKSNEILFAVEDTGVGMHKKQLDRLFKIDKNVSTPGTENEAGTGLGLILCKDFIQMHNGNIWVESERGKGSRFYFTLPKP